MSNRDELVTYEAILVGRQMNAIARRQASTTTSQTPFFPTEISGRHSGVGFVWKEKQYELEDYPALSRIGLLGHNGMRETARNSKFSYRGFTVWANRKIQHESHIERRVAQLLQSRRDLKDIRSQYPLIHYKDESDTWHKYTFDFLVLMHDGTRIAISVKPEKHREREEAKLSLVANIKQGLFDVIVLYTDAEATLAEASNARFLLHSIKNATEEHVKAARELMLEHEKSVLVWQLYDNGFFHWGRYAAIGSLIYNDELTLEKPRDYIRNYSRLIIN